VLFRQSPYRIPCASQIRRFLPGNTLVFRLP
jgi:hypothetical protein